MSSKKNEVSIIDPNLETIIKQLSIYFDDYYENVLENLNISQSNESYWKSYELKRKVSDFIKSHFDSYVMDAKASDRHIISFIDVEDAFKMKYIVEFSDIFFKYKIDDSIVGYFNLCLYFDWKKYNK